MRRIIKGMRRIQQKLHRPCDAWKVYASHIRHQKDSEARAQDMRRILSCMRRINEVRQQLRFNIQPLTIKIHFTSIEPQNFKQRFVNN